MDLYKLVNSLSADTLASLSLYKPELALEYFQKALKVNPNLRSLEAAVADLRRAIIEKRKGTI